MKRNLLILALIVWNVLACSSIHDKPANLVPKREEAAAVTPEAKKTVEFVGKTSDVLDKLFEYAQTQPLSENYRIHMIDGLTLARKEVSEAKQHAAETETRAIAKDAEAKGLREDVDKANANTQREHDARVAAEGERDAANKKLSGFWHSITTWVFALGMGLCFILIVVGVYVAIKGDLLNGAAAGGSGAAGLTIGILFMTMADFFETYKLQVGIGVCVLGVVMLGLIGYFAYKRLHDGGVSVVKGFQALIAAGKIDLAEVGPILDAIQTKFGKVLVDKNTPKKDANNHVLPAMSLNDNSNNVRTSATGGTD